LSGSSIVGHKQSGVFSGILTDIIVPIGLNEIKQRSYGE